MSTINGDIHFNTPTVIRALLQQFPYWYPCFARTDNVFIYETQLPFVGCGYDRPISFFPSPISSNDLSRLFPYVHLTIYLFAPPSSLFLSIRSLLASLFLSLSLFPSVESSTLQSGAATYTIRWIPSPDSRTQRGTEPNQTEHAWYSTTTENTAEVVSIFCYPGVRERERSSGRFHRVGRYRVYVDL